MAELTEEGRVGASAVVLLHRGDPASADEVRPFLRALYADPLSTSLPFGSAVQDVAAGLVARLDAGALSAKLAALGGRLAWLEQADAQARALEAQLGEPVRAAFAYRGGGLRAALEGLKGQGVTSVVGVSLYPHAAARRGQALVRRFIQEAEGLGLEVSAVDRLGARADYAALLQAQLEAGLQRLPDSERDQAAVVGVAPGIDKADLDAGDDYRAQVDATVQALVAQRPNPQAVAWLGDKVPGPDLAAALSKVRAQGARTALLVPLGTAVDELVVLHGLEVEARAAARASGLERLERAPQLLEAAGFPALLAAALADHRARLGSLGFGAPWPGRSEPPPSV